MQLERQQFWVYQIVVKKCKVLLWMAFLLVIIILVTFIRLRLEYSNTPETGYLQRCLDTYFQKYKPEKGYLVNPHQLLRIQMITAEGDALLQQSECSIKLNERYSGNATTLYVYEDPSLEVLSSEMKKTHKVQTIYVALAMEKIANSRIDDMFGLETIMVNKLSKQLIRRGISLTFIRDFSKSQASIQIRLLQYITKFQSFLYKLSYILLSVCRFFFSSILCGLIVTTLNILGNSLLIPILQIYERYRKQTISATQTSEVSQISSTSLFIGEHLDVFRNSPNKSHLKLTKYIIFGFIGITFVIVASIEGFLEFAANSLVGGYYKRMNVVTLIMLCVLEELSLLLLRTRTSIKYGPSIIGLIYCIGLYLNQIDPYSLPQFYIYGAFLVNLCFILGLAIFVEGSVANCPDSATFKPTMHRPRATFFPVFNLPWHNSSPPLWSYFVPQHPREYFDQTALSYVDQNYDMLYSQLMGLPNLSDSNDNANASQPVNEQTQGPLQQFDSDDHILI